MHRQNPAINGRRVTAIVNPATRRNPRTVVELLKTRLEPIAELKVIYTPGPNTAGELARQHASDADVMIAVGGDGTVGEVASGLVGLNVPLGIVPAGSTNIIALELGIPKRIEKAVSGFLTEMNRIDLDLGRCNDRNFLHMAGMGLDSWIFEKSSSELKRRIGWMAYVGPTLDGLRQPPLTYHVTYDGEDITVTSPLILVANGRSVLSPSFPLLPTISSQDGWLNLIVFQPKGIRQTLATLRDLGIRRLKHCPHVFHARARSIRIETEGSVSVETDGEVLEATPALFDVQPGAATVLIPPRR